MKQVETIVVSKISAARTSTLAIKVPKSRKNIARNRSSSKSRSTSQNLLFKIFIAKPASKAITRHRNRYSHRKTAVYRPNGSTQTPNKSKNLMPSVSINHASRVLFTLPKATPSKKHQGLRTSKSWAYQSEKTVRHRTHHGRLYRNRFLRWMKR